MKTSSGAAPPPADEHGVPPPPKQRSSHGNSLRGAILFLVSFIVLLIVFQIQVLQRRSALQGSAAAAAARDVLHGWEDLLVAAADGGACQRKLDSALSRLRDSVTFLPLKDLSKAATPVTGTTWFMSSLNDTFDGEDTQHLRFPSPASRGRLLCILGNHTRNGTMNLYALAWPDALPAGAARLPGLTFVSDTYYDYRNLWHGLAAMMPFYRWHLSKGCALPARWVLYHWGELRTAVGSWLQAMTEIALGQELMLEDFAALNGRPACFEDAVVFRHNEGVMRPWRRREVYDMLRCKAREFCNATSDADRGGGAAGRVVRLTLLLRTGARSFRNESAVVDIFRAACARFDGCRFAVAWANKLGTFCDQVRTLSATDVLVSPHGAQLTNMFFMDRNSTVMEMFPKGWLKLAGPGQYVYHWLAGNSGMRHPAAWRDPGGAACPYPEEKDVRCFTRYFKHGQLGHDAAYFANWTSAVLGQMRELKRAAAAQVRPRESCACES